MKHKAIISDRIYISGSRELLNSIADTLTYILPLQHGQITPTKLRDYIKVSDNIVSIPAGRMDLIPEEYPIVDKREDAHINFPKLNKDIILREDQQEVYDKVEDSCIINANPGFGKTIMALSIASKFKRKTLIVVHTKVLLDQWKDRIKAVLGVDCGVIGGGRFDTNNNITVATVQTLSKDMKVKQLEVGLLIIDECHRAASKSWLKILNNCKAKIRIGLSATLNRKDGKISSAINAISTNIVVPKEANRLKPIVKVISLPNVTINAAATSIWANLSQKVYSDPRYINSVLASCNAAIEAKMYPIIIAERVELLEILRNNIEGSVLVYGSTENREECIAAEHTAIVGNRSILSEGFDKPEMDCLVLASLINNEFLLEQIIGRITRPYKGKTDTPVVIDFKLGGNTGLKQFNNRLKYYLHNKYKVQYVE